MNIGGVITNDLCNGIGIRTSVFVSGCENKCPNCHNPELWDYNYGISMTDEVIDKIIDTLARDGIKKNLSILGGEPLMPKNLSGVAYLIKKVREAIPDIEIWLWTGFKFKKLCSELKDEDFKYILKNVDVIIDGQFIESLKPGKHLWRGSSNQEIWRKINSVWMKDKEKKNG